MTKKEKRMTEMIRVYPETAELIRQIVKRSDTKTRVADVVEAWAREVYPDAYKAVKNAAKVLDQVTPPVEPRED